MNRFSRDIGCLDELLPKTFLLSSQYALMVSTAILVPAATNPWLLLVFVPATFLAVYITSYYLKTSRELKRLESICRSPVFSHVSETLNGLDTIRTRKRQDDFVDRFQRCVEIFFFIFSFLHDIVITDKHLGKTDTYRVDLCRSLLPWFVTL